MTAFYFINEQYSQYYHIYSLDTVKMLITFINKICHDNHWENAKKVLMETSQFY